MVALGGTALAQTAPPPAEPEAADIVRIGGRPSASGPCVTVDIAGHRAGYLECSTLQLQDAARAAQAEARAGIDAPVAGAGSPDVRIGVANETATRLRMGDAFGRSVHSQRPGPPAPMPRAGGPRP